MPTFSNLLLIQPDLLNIKPMMSEDASVEELDGELRKIAEDVLNAAQYSITAIAAEPDAKVRPDTLEADFQTAFKSVQPSLRTSATAQAVELVKAPVAVRYAWADNPDASLVGGSGLPASPFRSDDWPGVTAGRR